MTLEFITKLLNKKMEEDENFVKVSFYELKIKANLSEEDICTFLNYSKIRLENLNYKVYLSGEQYSYKNENKKVEPNELLIAIKQNIE